MQIVGYEPTPDPALLVAADGSVERVPLDAGRTLGYRLGRRHCAGVIQNDRHDPCAAAGTPYCERHAEAWNDVRGRLADSDEEHAVYLAAFAPATFKVGVTRAWRLETRLREQGADRAAHAFTAPDGRVAREIEADVAAGEHGRPIPERVRVPTKIRGIGRSVDEEAWETLLSGFEIHDRFDFDYGLDVDGQPVPETIAAGTVRGVKGRILVIETGETTYAVDLRDLVGHEVTPGDSVGDRQSSLGSFE